MAFTHEVIHKGFYRRMGGELKALPVGTKLELTTEQGERMVRSGLVKPIEGAKTKPTIKPDPEPVKAETPQEKTEEKPKPKNTKKRKSKR